MSAVSGFKKDGTSTVIIQAVKRQIVNVSLCLSQFKIPYRSFKTQLQGLNGNKDNETSVVIVGFIIL